MTERVTQILEEALRLPAAERADVVSQLLSSLGELDPTIDERWAVEAVTRLAAYNAEQQGSPPMENALSELEETSPIVNRSVVVLRPRLPFVDWVATVTQDEVSQTAPDVERDLTAYLVPSIEEDGDEDRLLRFYYQALFEEELAAWLTDESAWPSQRDLKTFRDWFDVEFHSLVIDLDDEPLQHA